MKEKEDRNAELDISCSNCGHEFKMSLGWLEKNPEFSCPNSCGFLIKSNDFVGKVDEAIDEAANFLSKSIKVNNKKLNL